MYDITLICTCHRENGKCNSDELYKILGDLNPEVIFDELPSDSFERYYGYSSEMIYINSFLQNRQPPEELLEVKCIKRYKQTHNIDIFLVDVDVRGHLSKHKHDTLSMFSKFFENETYINLDEEKETLTEQEGFHYLNSKTFIDYLEKKEAMEKNIMESQIQKNKLLDTYKLFHAINEDRERVMLSNIYNYSARNQFDKAVFLIGAEHKKSILQKISEHEKLSEVKLNWTMYGSK